MGYQWENAPIGEEKAYMFKAKRSIGKVVTSYLNQVP